MEVTCLKYDTYARGVSFPRGAKLLIDQYSLSDEALVIKYPAHWP